MKTDILGFLEFLNGLLRSSLAEIGDEKDFSNLTISQLNYIDAINEVGRPTITDVAYHLGYSKASVTAGMKKLIQCGYVTKKQSQEDRRIFYLNLTEKGDFLVEAKEKAIERLLSRINTALNENEIKQFETLITKLTKSIHDTSSS